LKQTRTGLLSYPLDPEEALGHMAASIYLQMTLHPDIVHIVGHTEANHAATAEDVITASKVARRAIENAVRGAPNFKIDPIVQTRKEELISEAHITLDAIHKLVKSNVKDPWADPATLAKAVTSGILDAPQLKNNRFGRGTIQSKIIKGMCLSVDPSGKSINEKERLSIIKKEEE
jgi:hypothetical protein